MNTNLILESKTLAELIDAIEDFCRYSVIRENDDAVMQLKEQINEILWNRIKEKGVIPEVYHTFFVRLA